MFSNPLLSDLGTVIDLIFEKSQFLKSQDMFFTSSPSISSGIMISPAAGPSNPRIVMQ